MGSSFFCSFSLHAVLWQNNKIRHLKGYIMNTNEQKIERLFDLCWNNDELDECVDGYLTSIVDVMLASLKKTCLDAVTYYYNNIDDKGDNIWDDEIYAKLRTGIKIQSDVLNQIIAKHDWIDAIVERRMNEMFEECTCMNDNLVWNEMNNNLY